jgi:hypothetical protein
MTKVIKQGNNQLVRESISDVDALLNDERFGRMSVRHLETMRKHCEDYPIMDKERKVTITLSLKPLINPTAKREGHIEYDRAVFSAAVGSPSLPSTSVEFNCVVIQGHPYFNLEDAENPLQLTFRDVDGTNEKDDDEPVKSDRKSRAVKN